MKQLALIWLVLTAFCGGTNERGANEQGNKLHPIFSPTKWTYLQSVESYITDPDGTKIVWRKILYYKHPNGYWFKSEHIIFGKLVFKAFGVNDKNGKVLEHWIRVENNFVWYTARAGKDSCPLWNKIKDSSGKVVAVEIALVDEESGKEVTRRTVKRKF